MKRVLCLTLVVALFGGWPTAAEAAGKKKKNQSTNSFTGRVVTTTPGEKDGDAGSVTLKVLTGKKKQPVEGERKLSIGKDTKFEVLTINKKAGLDFRSGAFADLKEGEQIVVQLAKDKESQVERVLIVSQAKKKKTTSS